MGKRTAFISFIAASMAVIPISVYASHQFDDVPSDHTFHNSIDWLAETGITQGCNPPENDLFCPDDSVNRGQMATFLKRFHDRFIGNGAAVGLGIVERQQTDPPSTGNGVIDDLSLNLDIPVEGVLVITTTVDMVNETESDAFSCGINTGGSPSAAQGDSWRVIDLTTDVGDTCSTMTTGIASPGSQVARVVISGALNSTQARGGTISATLYTGGGVFGLLDENDVQTEAPELSDTPKGS